MVCKTVVVQKEEVWRMTQGKGRRKLGRSTNFGGRRERGGEVGGLLGGAEADG